MAAADHFGPQLQMFIPAHALTAEGPLRHGDRPDDESMEDFAASKVGEAKRGGKEAWWDAPKPGEETLHDSIQREGVKTPVSIAVGMDASTGKTIFGLNDGHHRAFSAKPDSEVPVRFSGTPNYIREHYPEHYQSNWEKYL